MRGLFLLCCTRWSPLVDVLEWEVLLCYLVPMRRREFITSVVSTIAALPFAGLAQTASKVYRIGVLSTDKPLPEPISGAIMRALASRGYIPDRNVALEFRASGDHWDQLPKLAQDLVAS